MSRSSAVISLTLTRRREALQDDPTARAAAEAHDLASTGAQADAFEKGIRSARVVRLQHANHYVFLSNQQQLRVISKLFLTFEN